jgi:hypothetical protein
MNAELRKLFLLHFAGNALLLWLGYEWLGVGESSGPRLALSAFEALALLTLACWLHGAAFAHFRLGTGIKAAFVNALRHLALLLIAAILVLTLYGLIAWAAGASGQAAFKLASWLTLKLRTPVKPPSVVRIFGVCFWILRWIVLPVGLLPMARGIATRGWRGFGEITWFAGWRYWLAVPVLLAAGFILPFSIIGLVPHVNGFALELISFAIRLLVAYLLFVGSALALAFVTSRGKPAVSQPKTVAVP